MNENDAELSTLDKIPIIGNIRKRMRLELATYAAVNEQLNRYKDPKTGIVYVAPSRWHPVMVKSVLNRMDIDVKTGERDNDT